MQEIVYLFHANNGGRVNKKEKAGIFVIPSLALLAINI